MLLSYSSVPNATLVVAATFAGALLFSLLAVWLVRKYAPQIGLVDRPAQHKFHSRIMPKGGGIAIALSLASACLLGWHLGMVHAGDRFTAVFTRDLFVILGGGLAIAVVGLVDDYRNLSPWTKIIAESAVATLLFWCDIRITLFVSNPVFSFAITWAWILLITNAFNLLDNMDGLSAGVAFISGAIFLAVSLQTRQWHVSLILAGALGSVLGFLCFNFPPAKIFMGDCGSLLLGYIMAVLTIYATFYQPSSSVFPVALPLLVMAVPLFDTTTVVWIRIKEKRPIFKGDTQHFSHRLVHLGMTVRESVLTIYLITFATGLSATLLYQANLAGGIVIIVQILAILAVIRILERVGATHGK